ncbi:phage integrase SAM-like domain-containing protein [Fibrella forsythiae]|uniref:Phage integrase SAM-like domain-containing protein n=1 Tax=Fibrella forsythiae TaxID=2817061 RepID=A0ABS3JAF3_9BACT|nr:phage integrase SAM-like domain-containing protein [Fibrella forsythiae]MBO0946973.1 phage integrase SAM-like domain-containing protein [Fibrella forsythiae]
MALLFWFRKSVPSGEEGILQMRLTYNTQREELGSTHISCKRSQWDQEHQRFKGKSLWAQEQNLKLAKLTKRIDLLCENLEKDGHELSAPLIKNFFKMKGQSSGRITHQRTQFTWAELAALHLEHQQKRKKLGKIVQATLDVQANYVANITDYLTGKRQGKLPAVSLTDEFMEDLELHLAEVEKFAPPHIEKHLKHVKQVMKWATARQLIHRNPIVHYVIECGDEDPDTTHLTIDELKRLIAFDFYAPELIKRIKAQSADALSAERDAFVFNCFTGMHHCDYTNKLFHIEQDKQGIYWLTGKRQKTGQEFFLKLLEPAVDILLKYGGQLANLPTKSNQRRNDSLKPIMVLVDLPYLTTKIARKTFADLALNEMLIPADDVATMLGLRSTKRLKHYVRPRRERLAKLLTSWNELV